jgi:hypothetical protein
MAAKVINLSDDAGATWYALPGSEGSFQSEAEQIDDTILGQTYQSNEVGLVSWSVSSNGIFKGFAGYLAEIKKAGTPTLMTDEPTSLVTGKTYQIDDVSRRAIDRTGTIVVEDNSSPVAASNIESMDYLFGRVTFVSGYSVVGSVTITADYMPLTSLGKANTYNLTMTAEAIDESTFDTAQANSGTRNFIPGLRTVALELGGIYDSTEDSRADLIARNELIIDIDPEGNGATVARGFFKLATASQAGAVGALEEETLNFTLTVPIEETNDAVEFPFSWEFTNSTLQNSIQIAITAWLNELDTYEVQYLPNGATGQSPLDGVEGTVVFTDISLSGGLSNMNVFTVEMQGNDQYTVV